MKETMAAYFICLSDAPRYLKMSKKCFNTEVAPKLIKVFIGDHKGFMRKDLDAWAMQCS